MISVKIECLKISMMRIMWNFFLVKYTENFMELKWMYAEYDIEPVFVKLAKFDLISADLNGNCSRFYPIGT